MILLDFSQVAIGNLHQQLKLSKSQLEPNLLRHMVLNSIRKANKEFSRVYGLLVICTDGYQYWRRQVFPQYKANRKKDRDRSDIDWPLVFEVLSELRDELREHFPYKVMNVFGAEADDIIATLTKHHHAEEQILIVSGDKDFLQLQSYPNVDQYNPTRDQFLKTGDPGRFLREHILRGDRGDGIPNFLSDDDVFVSGGRQSAIRETKLDVWLTQAPEEFCDERTLKHYERNKVLVDLSQIPSNIEDAIREEWQKPVVGSKNKIYPYLIKQRMRNLLDCIHEF